MVPLPNTHRRAPVGDPEVVGPEVSHEKVPCRWRRPLQIFASVSIPGTHSSYPLCCGIIRERGASRSGPPRTAAPEPPNAAQAPSTPPECVVPLPPHSEPRLIFPIIDAIPHMSPISLFDVARFEIASNGQKKSLSPALGRQHPRLPLGPHRLGI